MTGKWSQRFRSLSSYGDTVDSVDTVVAKSHGPDTASNDVNTVNTVTRPNYEGLSAAGGRPTDVLKDADAAEEQLAIEAEADYLVPQSIPQEALLAGLKATAWPLWLRERGTP